MGDAGGSQRCCTRDTDSGCSRAQPRAHCEKYVSVDKAKIYQQQFNWVHSSIHNLASSSNQPPFHVFYSIEKNERSLILALKTSPNVPQRHSEHLRRLWTERSGSASPSSPLPPSWGAVEIQVGIVEEVLRGRQKRRGATGLRLQKEVRSWASARRSGSASSVNAQTG